MKSFDKFKESIAGLDVEIGSKKQEYNDLINKMNTDFTTKTKEFESQYKEKVKQSESNYKEKNKTLDTDYKEKNKSLDTDYKEKTKQLETTYKDRSKQLQVEFDDESKRIKNMLEDSRILMKREITQDKDKYCKEYAKELKMQYMKDEEYKAHTTQLTKATRDYEDLKKNFDRQVDIVRTEEIKKHAAIMKTEKDTLQLTSKAENATLTAQLEQQKNEIKVLMQTIENMKGELAE